MNFADLFANPNDPRVVAQAWKDLNQQLKRDEGTEEELAWRQKFGELASRGFSPADALMPAAASDGSIAPGTGVGSGYQPPSELERWQSQIDGLISSGNPVLQKQGLDMIASYQARATAQEPTAPAMSKYGKLAQEMGFTPGTEEFGKQVRRLAEKDMKGSKQSKVDRVSVSESKNLFFEDGRRVPPGTPWESIVGQVVYGDEKGDEEAQISQSVYDIANDALFGENGIYAGYKDDVESRAKFTVMTNTQRFIQEDPKYRNYIDFSESVPVMLAKSFGESGALSNQDIARALKFLPSITGLFPDTRQVAERKMQLLQQLIDAHTSGNKAKVMEILAKSETIDSKSKGNGPAAPGYSIGQVNDGYRYLGGDPKSQDNWEEIE